MSWIEKTKENIIITTGDGVSYNPLYVITSKNFDFNLTEYNFINVPGSLIERREPRGTRYSINIMFQGDDHLERANDFEISSKNKKPWIIEHPMFGRFTAQPTRLTFDPTGLNNTRVTGEIIETITEVFPKAPEDPKQTAIDFSNDFGDFTTAIFEGEDFSATEQNNLLNSIENGFSIAASNISSATDFNEYFNILNSTKNSISNIQNDAFSAFQNIRKFIIFPAFISESVRFRFNIFRGQINQLIGNIKNDMSVTEKKVLENNLGNQISGLIITAVTPLGPDDFSSADEVVEFAEELVSIYNNFIDILDEMATPNNLNEDSYSPDFESLNELQNGVFFVSSQLLNLSLGAEQKRELILPENDDVINLTHRFYGLDKLDENINRFIRTNQISLNGLLELKKGEKIVYFV